MIEVLIAILALLGSLLLAALGLAAGYVTLLALGIAVANDCDTVFDGIIFFTLLPMAAFWALVGAFMLLCVGLQI